MVTEMLTVAEAYESHRCAKWAMEKGYDCCCTQFFTRGRCT
jgi:hypothetical protein